MNNGHTLKGLIKERTMTVVFEHTVKGTGVTIESKNVTIGDTVTLIRSLVKNMAKVAGTTSEVILMEILMEASKDAHE